MRYSTEQLRQRYRDLPEAIKNEISSSEFNENLANIGKKYNLHIDQQGVLQDEIAYVIYSLENPANFHKNLIKYLGLSEDLVNLIVYDLNSQVFLKIRHELEKITAPDGSVRESQEVTRDSAQAMFEQKMGGVNNIPKQEVEVKTQTGDNKTEAPTAQPRDPYREAI